MKNFLEALDIDKKIDIKLRLSPISANGDPNIQVKVCDEILFEGFLCENKTLVCTKNVDDLLSFRIKLMDKKYHNEKDTACVIQEISVDGHEVVPRYQQLSLYDNDHNKKITTTHLGYNGTWSLNIDKPFYIWLHSISGQGLLVCP